jgi:predicted NBD/HSP70 family sugar kinase
MAQGDGRARRVFETIGAYFGYAIAQYADSYDLQHVLVLGRVTSGEGGSVLLKQAQMVLDGEFPDVARKISLHLPGEQEKRHGQAVVAASLPALDISR